MKPETAKLLNQLNREFYRENAASFDHTRQAPWPGWRVCLSHLQARFGDAPFFCLDLGCGNGRFGQFLFQHFPSVSYTGTDQSTALLNLAHTRLAAWSERVRLQQADLLADVPLAAEDYDLIVLFGVLHHVPGFANRQRLLWACADHLRPNGLLIISFWQFGSKPRFRKKMVPWSVLNADPENGSLDLADLEEHDYLLSWQNSEPPYRYCHWTEPDEQQRLIEALPLTTLANFAADGSTNDLNHYRILQKGF